MEILNPIAELESPDSGKIVDPEGAIPLRKTNQFFCPDHDCKDTERRLSLVCPKHKRPHFRHWPSFEHEIRPETMLHKLAVRWFEAQESITVPQHKEESWEMTNQVLQVLKEETKCEYRRLERHIPDVRLRSTNDFEFAIEVVVTSDINEEKAKLIHEFGLPTIRIDLSKFYDTNQEQCRSNYDFIVQNLDNLLSDIKNMSWVILPSLDENREKLSVSEIPIVNTPIASTSKSESDNSGCALVILTLGLILLFK